ncbi:unnamed protein product [Leuciscus chuanchicus]
MAGAWKSESDRGNVVDATRFTDSSAAWRAAVGLHLEPSNDLYEGSDGDMDKDDPIRAQLSSSTCFTEQAMTSKVPSTSNGFPHCPTIVNLWNTESFQTFGRTLPIVR